MDKLYTVDYIRNMVKRGILLGPEAGQALLDEIDRLTKEYDEEVEQFNAGYEAAQNYQPIDNAPSFENDYDTWVVGWAWGNWNMGTENKLRAELEKAYKIANSQNDEIDQAHNVLDQAGIPRTSPHDGHEFSLYERVAFASGKLEITDELLERLR